MTIAFAVAGRNLSLTEPRFLSAAAFGLLWLYLIEGLWFSAQLQGSTVRGFGQATILIGQWLIILFGTLYVIR
jgi:hypothetical protein